MMFFDNEKVELWKYGGSYTYDDYGEPQKDYSLSDVISADFQPLSPADSLREFGEILQDTYKIYVDSDVEVEPTMILRINNDTYTIKGTPMDNNHFLKTKHKKLVLQKQRKPTPLPTIEEDGG